MKSTNTESPRKRAVPKPISLYPDQLAHVAAQSAALHISVSAFFQECVNIDMEQDIVRKAMLARLNGK